MKNAETKPTKHSNTCNMAFGRKDPTCPRCVELLAGAAPRKLAYDPSTSARREAVRIEGLKAHDCKARGCGVVCTYGDW